MPGLGADFFAVRGPVSIGFGPQSFPVCFVISGEPGAAPRQIDLAIFSLPLFDGGATLFRIGRHAGLDFLPIFGVISRVARTHFFPMCGAILRAASPHLFPIFGAILSFISSELFPMRLTVSRLSGEELLSIGRVKSPGLGPAFFQVCGAPLRRLCFLARSLTNGRAQYSAPMSRE